MRRLEPRTLCALALALMIGATAWVLRRDRVVEVEDGVSYALPASLPPDYTGDDLRFCQDEQCLAVFLLSRSGPLERCTRCGGDDLRDVSLAERTLLPADVRILKRHYTGETHRFDATIVRSGLSRSGIHRPEVCLVAQGFRIVDERVARLESVSGRAFAVTRLRAAHAAGLSLYYAYWFRGGDLETARHATRLVRTAADGIMHNRRRRWHYVAVTMVIEPAFGEERNLAALDGFLAALYDAIDAAGGGGDGAPQ